MTELPPYEPPAHDWVAGYVDDSHPVRDEATHALIRKLTGLLAPAPGEHVAIESYYEPSANAWRVVAHKVPVLVRAESPEDEEARRRAVLEEALSSPQGRALAEAILERKRIAAELDGASARAARATASAHWTEGGARGLMLPTDPPRPADWEADLGKLPADVAVHVEDGYVPTSRPDLLGRDLTRGTGEAFA